jgi:methionyl aminopeptidase
VGEVAPEIQRLIRTTREALEAGIQATRAGSRLGDVSAAIQSYVEGAGFSVVREYTGHGIGREMHEEPRIKNYGRPGTGLRLRAGMVLALEPMVNVGVWNTRVLDDEWTVVTADGKPSAHFEHTIAVTENGAEILTKA